jgi:hypothetical protein
MQLPLFAPQVAARIGSQQTLIHQKSLQNKERGYTVCHCLSESPDKPSTTKYTLYKHAHQRRQHITGAATKAVIAAAALQSLQAASPIMLT